MSISVLRLPAATQQAIRTTVVPNPPTNLERLALAAPNALPLDDLAAAVGVRFELLHRVAQYRQPLPIRLVGPIADRLGVQRGEVEAAAGAVSDAGSALLPGLDFAERAEGPLPPDRCLGDAIFFRPLRPTVAPTFGS